VSGFLHLNLGRSGGGSIEGSDVFGGLFIGFKFEEFDSWDFWGGELLGSFGFEDFEFGDLQEYCCVGWKWKNNRLNGDMRQELFLGLRPTSRE